MSLKLTGRPHKRTAHSELFRHRIGHPVHMLWNACIRLVHGDENEMRSPALPCPAPFLPSEALKILPPPSPLLQVGALDLPPSPLPPSPDR